MSQPLQHMQLYIYKLSFYSKLLSISFQQGFVCEISGLCRYVSARVGLGGSYVRTETDHQHLDTPTPCLSPEPWLAQITSQSEQTFL